jgi:DNA polymerase-1
LEEVRRRGNWDYYINIMEPLQYAVIDMQKRGLLLDKPALKTYRKKVTQELNECDKIILAADPMGELSKPTPKYPNGIGSPKRLSKFLFTVLGLKSPKRTEAGFDSTDQDTLFRLLRDLRKKDEPVRDILLALFHRSRLKTISQRYLKLDVDPDGRVRAKVKMYGTKTYRFAYSEPALQQFPPEARHIFIPQSGYVYLSVDYSQLEARILSYLAGDKSSQEVFRTGEDIHEANTKDLFGWDSDKVVEKNARNYSKSFLYRITYGGESSLKQKLYCPCPKCSHLNPPILKLKRDEVLEAEARWFQKHPAVRQFHRELAIECRRNKRYVSPLGVRRYFSQPWGKDLERELKNCPMQMGAAVLMNRSQIRLFEIGAPIVAQMHDEFLLEVPRGEVGEWAEKVQGVMETPVPELDEVVFPTDVEWGDDWGSLKPWKP